MNNRPFIFACYSIVILSQSCRTVTQSSIRNASFGDLTGFEDIAKQFKQKPTPSDGKNEYPVIASSKVLGSGNKVVIDNSALLDLSGRSFPQLIDMREQALPVKDQGAAGFCTAFSSVAAIELLLHDRYAEEITLSETYFWSNYQAGELVSLLKTNENKGQIDDKSWPLSSELIPNSPCIAKFYGIHNNLDLPKILAALSQRKPIIMALIPNKSFHNPAPKGLVDPSVFEQKNAVGHAVVIVGYYIDREIPGGGFFAIKNSWGPNWGEHGFGYMPFSYCEKSGCEAHSIDFAEKVNDPNCKAISEPMNSKAKSGGSGSFGQIFRTRSNKDLSYAGVFGSGQQALQACQNQGAELLGDRDLFAAVYEGLLTSEINTAFYSKIGATPKIWIQLGSKSEQTISDFAIISAHSKMDINDPEYELSPKKGIAYHTLCAKETAPWD